MEFQLDQATEILSQTPAVLTALLHGKSPAWLNARLTANAFSPTDVLGHLVYGELTDWIPRVQFILKHRDTRPFEPFDRFGFRDLTAGRSIDDLLAQFTTLRRQGLETLQSLNLSPADLDLPGRHPEFGAVTLGHHLAAWVVHDLGHISQIVKTMACEYREAVGPWRAYTTIVQ